MATQTSKLKLSKPTYTDTADIQVINTNMDIVDSEFIKVDGELVKVKNDISSINIKNDNQDKDISDIKTKNNSQDNEIQALKNTVNNIKLEAKNVTIEDTSNNFTSTTVEGALTELFQNVDNGKGLIASAITDKGINASKNDSFQELSNKISGISSINVKTGTTLPSVVENGVLFVQTDTNCNRILIEDNPAVMVEGDIYIKSTSDSSQANTVPFIVGNSNRYVKIYVTFVKQRINGIDTTKNAWVGIDNKWIQFSWQRYIIFNETSSNLNSHIREGWDRYTDAWGENTGSSVVITGNPRYLKFTANTGYNSDDYYRWYIKQSIDVSPFKKLYFNCKDIYIGDHDGFSVGIISDTEDKVVRSKYYGWSSYPTNDLAEIDLSDLNGTYRIMVSLSSSYNGRVDASVFEIYLTS